MMSKHLLLLLVTLLVLTTWFAEILSFPAAQKEVSGVFQNDHKAMVSGRRQGRSVLQFGYMIQCLTNRNPYDYADYGCWCGVGGQGTPLDALDRCCYIHDKCYDTAIESRVCNSWWKVYLGGYQYKACASCDPLSAYQVRTANELKNASCKKFLCECDSAAARCFSQSYYNSTLVNYNSSNCK